MLPLLSLPAVAQSQVHGLVQSHYFFMHSHAIQSMGGLGITFIGASMVHIHILLSVNLHAYVVYLLSLWTHPLWALFQVHHFDILQVDGRRSSRGCALTNYIHPFVHRAKS
jgi:hypothetical protein